MPNNHVYLSEIHRNSLVIPPQQLQIINAILVSGTLSRTELARRLGYSRALITGLVKELVQKGILVEGEEAASTGGRRAKEMILNPTFGYVLGIDMGATSVNVALADFQGQILRRYTEALDVRDGPEPVLNRVLEDVSTMLSEMGILPEKILSIGLGVPGPVDFTTGVLIAPPIMPGWEQYPIRNKLYTMFPSATVIIDNDVNVMAMGELRTGAGKNQENFIFVKVGTGIGAGIVVDGHIYRGSNGCAGDIGHIQADRNGPVCHCGNIGCVEAMASGSAIARQAMEVARDGRSPILAKFLAEGVEQLNAEHVGIAAHKGDKVAMEIIKESGGHIGSVLAGVVNFFNPSLILIGGGVTNIGTQFLATIRRGILSRSLPLSTQHLRIDYSPMKDDAGVTGAVALALEHIFVAAS